MFWQKEQQECGTCIKNYVGSTGESREAQWAGTREAPECRLTEGELCRDVDSSFYSEGSGQSSEGMEWEITRSDFHF